MKGFIEVNEWSEETKIDKCLINVAHISSLTNNTDDKSKENGVNCIIWTTGSSMPILVMETYEEVKKMIFLLIAREYKKFLPIDATARE